MKILAVSGWKRSGKDTVASYLVQNYGFKRLAFADVLKDNVSREFDVGRGMIDHPELKEQPLMEFPVTPKDAFSRMIAEFMFREFRDADGNKPDGIEWIDGTFAGTFGPDARLLYWTPRALCILEGSTKRSADANHWVNRAVRETDRDGLYVISDTRYKNEIESLKRLAPEQVVSVRIDRFASVDSTDPSENDLNDYTFDRRINNLESEGKTLEDLKSQIDTLMSSLGIQKLSK